MCGGSDCDEVGVIKMRRLIEAVAIAGVGLLVGGCSGSSQGASATSTAPVDTTKPAAPVCLLVGGCSGDGQNASNGASAETARPAAPVSSHALKRFLLDPQHVNMAMSTTGMTLTKRRVGLSDDSDTMEPRECLAVDGATQAKVYAGSGFIAVRDEVLQHGGDFTHYAQQAVVLFPAAKHADAFFARSAKQWPECDEYQHLQSGTEWETGVVSNVGGMLSAIAAQQNAGGAGWACGRALTTRNNVVVDVNTCSADPGGSAVDIAKQIAANIPTEEPEF